MLRRKQLFTFDRAVKLCNEIFIQKIQCIQKTRSICFTFLSLFVPFVSIEVTKFLLHPKNFPKPSNFICPSAPQRPSNALLIIQLINKYVNFVAFTGCDATGMKGSNSNPYSGMLIFCAAFCDLRFGTTFNSEFVKYPNSSI